MSRPILTLGSRFGFVSSAVLCLMVFAAIATTPFYSGQTGYYILFQGACSLLLVAAAVGPRSYGFSAFAIFLLLGFWLKVTIVAAGLDPLIEPTGAFAGTGPEWDAALTVSSIGIASASVVRLLLRGFGSSRRDNGGPGDVPRWFAGHRRIVWTTTGVLVAAGVLANWLGRFYMVGVDVAVLLPFPLNAAIAWWLTAASAMWIALLLSWEQRLGSSRHLARLLLIPILEAFASSTVMLSRGFYIMKVLPYVLAVSQRRMRDDLRVGVRSLALLAIATMVGFTLTLVAVSWLRLQIYPTLILPAAPSADAQPGTSSQRAEPSGGSTFGRSPSMQEAAAMAGQLAQMIAGRWIGLEGVLAVAAYPDRSPELWRQALAEDPTAGTDAMYQRIAGADYKAQPGVTFLTIPGVLAVMAYAGSPWVMVVGMMLITILLLATEAWARYSHHSELLCATVGVFTANALVQMNFPYLTAVFFVELWITLLVLLLMRGSRGPQVSNVSADQIESSRSFG